jgi:UDP-N-acetylmuramate--alanine ligase
LPPPEHPLAGRRLWFVGIGGAGLSAYARLAAAWGAEVGGWDRVRTTYVDGLDAVVEIEPEPVVPDGWEPVVSTAYPQFAGTSRAAFLAELVALRRSIVVAGTHGKGTVAAMIAFVLRESGRDPAWLIGAPVAQLGANAGAGSGWLVVEGDESDRTVFGLPATIAVVTNVDLDHHSTFASRAEVEALFDEWLTAVPEVVRGDDLTPYDGPLALPGEHNRRNAACAVAALECVGVTRAEAEPVLAEFTGAGRRLELRGESGGVEVFDDYAHHPAEIAATLAAARDDGRVLVLFQPHLYSRTRHLAAELADALSAADAVAVTDVYPAREQPVRGVSGKLVVDALAERRPGMPLAWTPAYDDGAHFLARRARSGDRVLTIGAGDVDRAAQLLLELLR